MPLLADLGGPRGHAPAPRCQDPWSPYCYVCLDSQCLLVSRPNLASNSLDPPLHAIEGNIAMNTNTCAKVGTRFVTHISPCARLILNLFKYAYFKLFIINKKLH